MKSPVGDLAGEHRGARALAAFGVGASAQDRVAVDDRRALHPRAVLAERRRVADDVRGAGLENLHAAVGGELFAVLIYVEDLRLGSEGLPIVWISATLQAACRHERLRRLDQLVGVQVEERE